MISQSVIAVADAMRLGWAARQPSPQNSPLPNDSDYRFFALFGDNGQFDLAVLNIKNGVCYLPLRKDELGGLVFGNRSALTYLGQKAFGSNTDFGVFATKDRLGFFVF
jgi:hypothetical protein